LFSRIHCFFFRPLTKTMNRGFTVFNFLLWHKNLLAWKWQSFLTVPCPSCDGDTVVLKKCHFFVHPSYRPGPDFISSPCVTDKWPPLQQPVYITKPTPHLTYTDPRDEACPSKMLVSTSKLQDCTVSNPDGHNLKWYSVEQLKDRSEHVTCTEEILVGKSEGKTPFGRFKDGRTILKCTMFNGRHWYYWHPLPRPIAYMQHTTQLEDGLIITVLTNIKWEQF
jgi:hypothetical protein